MKTGNLKHESELNAKLFCMAEASVTWMRRSLITGGKRKARRCVSNQVRRSHHSRFATKWNSKWMRTDYRNAVHAFLAMNYGFDYESESISMSWILHEAVAHSFIRKAWQQKVCFWGHKEVSKSELQTLTEAELHGPSPHKLLHNSFQNCNITALTHCIGYDDFSKLCKQADPN